MAGVRDYRSLVYHPYNIAMVLLLSGLTMLFFGFSAAYLYNRIQSGMAPVRIPDIFYVNTLTLIASSISMDRAKKCYLEDKTPTYERFLLLTFVLSLIFLSGQLFGWYSLFRINQTLTSGILTAYLYVLSGIHLLHVVAGLPFLFTFWWVARNQMKEPVSVLVYFSDPDKKLKLRLLMLYWHFLDVLWIYLVVFLLINYFL